MVFVSVGQASEESVPLRLFSDDSYLLNLNMSFFTDPSNTLTIEEVSAPGNIVGFVKSTQKILNLGISSSTHWVRFSLAYPSAYPNKKKQKSWYLEVGRSVLDVAALYTPLETGGYSVMRSDLSIPFNDRYLSHANSIFPVTIPIGGELTYYLKVKNKSESIQFPLILWEPTAFINKVEKEEYIFGMYFGAMFILLFYNLFVYFSVRDTSYLYYIGYLGMVTLYQLLEIGHGAIYSGWLFEWGGKDWVAVVIWMASWFGVLFAKEYMNIEENHPRINMLYTYLLRIIVVSLVVSVFKKDTISIIWVSMFSVVFMVTTLLASIYIWLAGNENARFFCLAWVVNIAGLVTYSLMVQQLLPATTLTLFSAPLGIVLEATLLSFALADRIKLERKRVLVADRNTMDNLSQYRSVFDNSLEGMYQMSLSGKMKTVNASLAQMMGYSSVEKLLASESGVSAELYGGDSGDSGDKVNYQCVVEGGEFKREGAFSRDNVPLLWILHKARLVYGDAGEALYIEGTVVGVTDEKEREAALNEELKERIKKEIADFEAEQKNRFLSAMSYQIRTLLTSIIGFSEVMKAHTMTADEKRSCVDEVIVSSYSLLKLINNILDYSKIEAGKFDIECTVVDVMETIHLVSDSFLTQAEDKLLRFDLIVEYPIPDRVKGDPHRIMQVLNNLCGNAIRFTREGGVILRVSWADEKLMFTVSDTGVGMDEESMRRVRAGTLMEGSGSLGLLISKKLAELMGGGISVSSDVGCGCVFAFGVEAALASDVCWLNESIGETRNETAKNVSELNEKSVKSSPTLMGKVLLADDNVVNQRLIEKVLKKTGVDVVVANDGVEACDYCSKDTFDLVLMDINMPNRNGTEATVYLRKNGYKMPIYALTAETDKAEIEKILNVGCQGFLTKPLNKTHLYTVMEECLSKA